MWPPHLPGSESKPIYLSGEVAKVAVVEETGAEMAEAETDPEDSLVAWAGAETELRKDSRVVAKSELEVVKVEEECVVGAGVKQVDSEAEETQVETEATQEDAEETVELMEAVLREVEVAAIVEAKEEEVGAAEKEDTREPREATEAALVEAEEENC